MTGLLTQQLSSSHMKTLEYSLTLLQCSESQINSLSKCVPTSIVIDLSHSIDNKVNFSLYRKLLLITEMKL